MERARTSVRSVMTGGASLTPADEYTLTLVCSWPTQMLPFGAMATPHATGMPLIVLWWLPDVLLYLRIRPPIASVTYRLLPSTAIEINGTRITSLSASVTFAGNAGVG